MLGISPSAPEMAKRLSPYGILIPLLIAAIAVSTVALCEAITWYERPFAGVLVDPEGTVSSLGLPSWAGFRQGLRYPDQILAADGDSLGQVPGEPPARAFDRAVDRAARAGRATVHVRARTAGGVREIDLVITPFTRVAWWIYGACTFVIGLLYVLAAVVALYASPGGRLPRTFAKAAILAALFLFTLFDFHTTRSMIPLFHLAFALVPMSFFALALRLPDDVPLLARRPWIVGALDGAGLLLGVAMIVAHRTGVGTVGLRLVCSALFGASFFFFAVTFLVRFARARGDRRATMRALLLSMVPVHVMIGAAFALASLRLGGATLALCGLPALAATPLATVAAFIRHDLWGSRALLSRVLTRAAIIALAFAVSLAVGTAFAASFAVPLGDAFLAAGMAALVASLITVPALRVGDHAFFPSRAVYKPTIEQLSEELTLITVPEEVTHAVERTVRRWLPCDRVEFVPVTQGDRDSTPARHRSGLESGIRSILPAAPGRAEAEITLDVCFRGRPIAVLRAGKKRGAALFTSEDLDLLRTIGNQGALALASAQSYAELELRRRQEAHAHKSEREALIETVAAEISHEIRYPINFFRSIFGRGGAVHLDDEAVDIGVEEVDRLERLVAGLRRVSTRRLERQSVSMEEIATKVERLLGDRLAGRDLALDVADAPRVRCDPDQITQVVINLVSNALDAAGAAGAVGVTWARGAAPGSFALTVWDSGPGFDGDPDRLFAPWFTTKPQGTGLGLAITQRIVRAHGWTLDPERRGDRTYFVITVPAADLTATLAPFAGGGAAQEVA